MNDTRSAIVAILASLSLDDPVAVYRVALRVAQQRPDLDAHAIARIVADLAIAGGRKVDWGKRPDT